MVVILLRIYQKIDLNEESPSEDNYYEVSTCSGDSLYDIFDNDQKRITLHSKV